MSRPSSSLTPISGIATPGSSFCGCRIQRIMCSGVLLRCPARNERMASVPAKRFGTPDEFGAACAFLCSAQAGYITGQNLLIDGGVFPGAI